jgi:hypothetical protein
MTPVRFCMYLMRGKTLMNSNMYIDPTINMNSDNMVTIIIQFRTKPAQEAVLISQKSGVPISIENANWAVERSHERFQEEVKRYLVPKNVPFTINYIYKTALNGVSMNLPANEIKTLFQFKEIESIHANKEYHIDPPNIQNFEYE